MHGSIWINQDKVDEVSDFSLDENIFSPVYQTSQAIIRAVNFTIDNPSYFSEKPDHHPNNYIDGENFNFLGTPGQKEVRRALSGELDNMRDMREQADVKPITLKFDNQKKMVSFNAQFPEIPTTFYQLGTQTDHIEKQKTIDIACQSDLYTEKPILRNTESQTIAILTRSVTIEAQNFTPDRTFATTQTEHIEPARPSVVSVSIEVRPPIISTSSVYIQTDEQPPVKTKMADRSCQTEASNISHVGTQAVLSNETASKCTQVDPEPISKADVSLTCHIVADSLQDGRSTASNSTVSGLIAGMPNQVNTADAPDMIESKSSANNEKIEKLESMVVNYELSLKSKVNMISAYKEKLENAENTQKKQNELIKKKDEDNEYYLESIISAKKEYMELQEKYTNLQLSISKNQQKNKEKADKEKEGGVFQALMNQII